MGTSVDAVMTDKLGRRSGPRRKYTITEKRAMVEETHVRGASVPEVALRHGVNANLLSVWRRLYRQGTLVDEERRASAALLPVKVSTPTVLPSERATTARRVAKEPQAYLEVEFAGGPRLRIRGRLDRQLLRELISVLSGR
jgi:transposase